MTLDPHEREYTERRIAALESALNRLARPIPPEDMERNVELQLELGKLLRLIEKANESDDRT
jgi:hypothetical protein